MVATTGMISDAPSSDELLQAALEYARQGWAVFPVHTPINGVCDCYAGENCKSPGKHPWTKNGLSDATTEELTIRRWWRDRPIANIGLTVRDGYAIVDVDGEHGQRRLAEQGLNLQTTAVQSSGRGAHYVYRVRNRVHPRILIKESGEDAHDGVDLRGPGSYVVAAPSVHYSGRCYEWAVPLTQVDIAPSWLEDVAQQSGGSEIGDRSPVDFGVVLAGLPEGSRKWELYRAAAKLRAADVPLDLAVMLAQQAAANCSPPLEAKEAERKVREAYSKYPPNASARDLPAGVTLLGHDSVMVEFETCRFVFSDLEKSGRELHAEMEVQNLLPGQPKEPYIQRLNLLSMSARDQCRREIEHVLGKGPEHQWTALFSRAIAKAQHAFLNVDRSIKTSDIEPPAELGFVVPDLCVEDGFSILFGEGSAGKTWILMLMALCVSLGIPFLGRPLRRRNVLYFDCETGRRTYGLRMRRICEGLGLTLADAENVRFWPSEGVPFEDQIDALKRCCEENQIEFVALDHIAAACSGDANEQSVASRFARAVGKLGLPVMALAHITGADMKNPESVNKPFGSIYWHNNSRRTIFVMRRQEDESSVADLGLYPKKINDGKRPSPFGARITFDDPSGPVAVEPESLGGLGGNLNRIRGAEHAISDILDVPLTTAEIADLTGFSERHVKRTLADHPQRFVMVSGADHGGRSNAKKWAKVSRDQKQWWQDNDELPF
jgi:hypothetical protein